MTVALVIVTPDVGKPIADAGMVRPASDAHVAATGIDLVIVCRATGCGCPSCPLKTSTTFGPGCKPVKVAETAPAPLGWNAPLTSWPF